MAVTASMVRELRDKTGAAMMDCKKALEASGGDMDAALDHLRKQGLKTAAKKAGRETSEGRVSASIADDGTSGALVAVRCETDFVANTDDFGSMMERYANAALAADLPAGDATEAFLSTSIDGSSVSDDLQQVIGRLGENIQFARVSKVDEAGSFVGVYIHHNGKVGALASVATTKSRDEAQGLLGRLCQHIAFTKPNYGVPADVPADIVDRERQVHMESDEVKSKPENIREKIVDGKIKAFFKDICLQEQPWIFDNGMSVAKAIQSELGDDAKLSGYAVFEI